MLKQLTDRRPGCLVSVQTREYEVLGPFWYRVEFFNIEVYFLCAYIPIDLFGTIAIEQSKSR